MISAGTVMAKMGLDMSSFNSGIDSVGSKLKGVGTSVSGISGVATAAIAGAGVAALGVLKSSVTLAEGAQKTTANLEQTIKSTGGAAGLTAKQVEDMADSFTKTTTFSKGTIEAGQSMLLTFTKIGKDVFPSATQAMLDMSQKMGTDPQQTAIQLGKALNDPVKGITALSRVGVTFTAQQKAQIAAMVKVGDTAGAQKVIIAELNKEFGGQAAAAAGTYAGKMKQMANSINATKVAIGTALLPTLQILLKNFVAVSQPIASWIQANPKLTAGILSVVGVMGTLVGGISVVTKAFNAFKSVATAINVVKTSFTGLKTASSIFSILPALMTPVGIGALAIAVVAIAVIANWGKVGPFFTKLFNDVKGVIGGFGTFLKNSVDFWENIFSTDAKGIGDIFSNLGKIMPGIGKNIINGFVNGIKSKFDEAKKAIKSFATGVGDTFKIILGIHSPSTVFAEFGMNTGQGYINGITGMESPIKAKLSNLANGIKSLGDTKPNFSGMDGVALSSYGGSHSSGTPTNMQKQMEFKPTINMYIKIADTGDKGTQQLTGELKNMAKTSLKDTMTDMFTKDAFRL